MLQHVRLPAAFALFSIACAPAWAQSTPPVRAPAGTPADGITVSATGYAAVPADSATVTLYISAPKNTIVPSMLSPIAEALVTGGVDRSSIQTTFDLTGQSAPTNSAQITARIDRPTVQKVRGALPAVVAAFASRPELNVGSAGVSLMHDACSTIVDAARSNAIAAARKRAGEVAQTLGVKVGRVVAFSDFEPPLDDRGRCSSQYNIGNYGPQRQSPDDLVTIRLTAQVTVRYAIR